MGETSGKIFVFCTCGSGSEAAQLARALVTARLAACVNLIPKVRSVYHWQGAVEEAEEWLLLIKSTKDRFGALEREITRLHSYEVPEIVAVDIAQGAASYLEWIAAATAADV